MELTSLCLLLCSLTISPERSQFFRYASMSLSCEGQENATGWRVKRNTTAGRVQMCSSGWGFLSPSGCTIRNAYPTDSGVYWCESRVGARSNAVNITVTDGPVILESPALPAMEGDAVTLTCRTKTTPSNLPAAFYKDRSLIRTERTGQMTIHNVSKSDEGTYECNIPGLGHSPESWLAVRASCATSSSSPPPFLSLPRLICHLVVLTPYLLSTIILVLIHRDRARAAQRGEENRSCDDVIMEIAP